jgi:hypothetical protein
VAKRAPLLPSFVTQPQPQDPPGRLAQSPPSAPPIETSINTGDIPGQIPARPIVPIYNPDAVAAQAPGHLRTMMDDSVNLHQQVNRDLKSTMAPPTAIPPTLPSLAMASDRVEDVPIPQLPGRHGAPRKYDPETKAEFDYVLSKTPKDENGMERKRTFKERLKGAVLPALLGAAQGAAGTPGNPLWGAVGGAATAGATSAIDPTTGLQYQWAVGGGRQEFLDQEKRALLEEQRDRERNKAALEEQRTLAGIRKDARVVVPEGAILRETGRPDMKNPKTLASRSKNVYTDQQGNVRDRDTNEIQLDPATGQPIKGQTPAGAQPNWEYNSDLGGFYEKHSGQTKPAPGAVPKLTGGDEKSLEGHAESLVARAFPPDQMATILKEYSDRAYSSRVSKDDEAKAANYDPVAQTKIRQIRAEADREARANVDRESQRWKQLFHDELRERARKGQPPPSGGNLTPSQVKAVAQAKNLSEQDAYRFLGALGYTFNQQQQQNTVTPTKQPHIKYAQSILGKE